MNRVRILRWNRLKRRAAALGVDVQAIVKIDAIMQSPEADMSDNRDDTPASPTATRHRHPAPGSHGVVDSLDS